MLSTARPLFQNLPGTFADPLGLADQQASGTTSLVVARYPADGETGPTYDAFVVASGGVVAVCRSTPDYRFPVAPAAAVRRFLDARGEDSASERSIPTLSLYEVDPDDGARFLESAFFAECLKVHVDGPASAPLVADQLARCGTTSGLLEINDFSDPATPRLSLVEITNDAPDLNTLLHGVRGRVLLYDRERNRAVARDRAGAPLDLLDGIAEADRLANARRARPDLPDSLPAPPSEADEVEATLRPTDETSPLASEASDPHATGLAALVAELQGTPLPSPLADDPGTTEPEPTSLPNPASQPPTESPLPHPGGEGQGEGASPIPQSTIPANRQVGEASVSEPFPIPSERANPPSPAPLAPHPLTKPLDALRVEVYGLFEEAVGQDRALAHDAHITADLDLPAPVPPEHAAAYLRALLTADPPRRWHFFKRSRAKCYEAVAARLLAFHGAHGHDARAGAREAVHDVAQLWARIHR